jgi:hypothetical protein
MLRTSATALNAWEHFTIQCNVYEFGHCYILSLANLQFVSVELDYSGSDWAMLRASATQYRAWEDFGLIQPPS